MPSFSSLRKVLVADNVDSSCAELLAENGLQVTTANRVTPGNLKDADCLVVRSQTKVTEALLKETCELQQQQSSARLMVIVRAGTGLDNIDLHAATNRGILVLNTPGGNSTSAAELTCAHIMSLARKVPGGCRSVKEGGWDRKGLMGTELAGKKLGVIGLGRIGREVSARMAGFSMSVLGFDPLLGPPDCPLERELAAACRPATFARVHHLRDLCRQADYITVHTPLIPETTGLIDEKVLMEWCKAGVSVINCARGGIVDEEGLLKALEAGRCAGAALDVFSTEPPNTPTLRALVSHPNVIATPHLGASTVEAQLRVALEAAQQIVALVNPNSGYRLSGVANASWLMRPSAEEGGRLAKVLGRVVGGLTGGSPRDVSGLHLEVQAPPGGPGDCAHLVGPLLAGFLAGLGPSSNGVNAISAPLVAARRGFPPPTTAAGTPLPPGSPLTLSLTINVQHVKHVVTGCQRDGDCWLESIDGCVFKPPLAVDSRTLLLPSADPNKDCPVLIGELAKQGAALRNMSVAGREDLDATCGVTAPSSCWISVRTDLQASAIRVEPLPSIRLQI